MRYLWLLGPVRVKQEHDTQCGSPEKTGRTLPRFRSKRTVALLGFLAAERRLMARDLLAALFWPGKGPAKGRANLSRELHNLAQVLPNNWQVDRQSVIFVPTADTFVDLFQLQSLVEQERWAEAADLLGGEFLEGLYLENNPEFENWLLVERERWQDLSGSVLTNVIDRNTRRGRYSEALHYARRLLQLIPWDEKTHVKVMCLLAWTGRRAAALQQYGVCKLALQAELDVEPTVETVAVYEQIRAGKLDLPPQLPAFLTDEKARHAYEPPSFVGRKQELAQLDGFLEDALAGKGRIVLITGGPGRGKTALLDAFTRQAMEDHADLLAANGRSNAYSGLGDPYLPFREVMAMLIGDVEGRWDAGAISREQALRLWDALPIVVQALLDRGPHLLDVLVPGAALLSRSLAVGQSYAPWLPRLREVIGGSRPDSLAVEQSYLFEQVGHVLGAVARERPLLLVLDDMQWADTASISLLFHLGRNLADSDSRIVIACAYRPEEVAVGRNDQRHPLAKVLSEFKCSFGDVWVDLGRTDKGESRGFVDALVDIEPNRLEENFRRALADRTRGHPLFTIELLRALRDRGDLLEDSSGTWFASPTLSWDVLPARVEAVIEERIDRLDPGPRTILNVASVEGEQFTAQVAAQVCDMPEKLVLNCLAQELERQHRLVNELEEVETNYRRLSRYQFRHVLFQDYVYKRLSQGERRLMHSEVGLALENLHEGQLDEISVQLAQHFQKSGEHEKAFCYFSMAGERAARLYENEEAVALFTRAIQTAADFSPPIGTLAKTYRGRGLASEKLGVFDQANSDHQTILQIAEAAGEQREAWRAMVDLGRLWSSRDYTRARGFFEAALQLANQAGESSWQADSLNWMGNWYANDGNFRKAISYHEQALAILEQSENRRDLARTLDLLGIANLLGSDIDASVRHYGRAIALFRELADLPGLVSSLVGRATSKAVLIHPGLVPANPAPDSMKDYAEALQIAKEIDSASDEAWVCWSSGMLHTVQGNFGQAERVIRRGLDIAAEIGHLEYRVGSQTALGLLRSEQFDLDRAQTQLEEALSLAKELRSTTWVRLSIGALANVYLMEEDYDSAQAILEPVIMPDTPMETGGTRSCWIRWAELALALNDPALALDITERLIASAPGMAPGRVIAYLWMLKAEILMATGEAAGNGKENAFLLLQSAIKNAEEVGERFLLWRLKGTLGRYFFAMGRVGEGNKVLAAAQALINEMAATIPDEVLRNQFRREATSFLLVRARLKTKSNLESSLGSIRQSA